MICNEVCRPRGEFGARCRLYKHSQQQQDGEGVAAEAQLRHKARQILRLQARDVSADGFESDTRQEQAGKVGGRRWAAWVDGRRCWWHHDNRVRAQGAASGFHWVAKLLWDPLTFSSIKVFTSPRISVSASCSNLCFASCELASAAVGLSAKISSRSCSIVITRLGLVSIFAALAALAESAAAGSICCVCLCGRQWWCGLR